MEILGLLHSFGNQYEGGEASMEVRVFVFLVVGARQQLRQWATRPASVGVGFQLFDDWWYVGGVCGLERSDKIRSP